MSELCVTLPGSKGANQPKTTTKHNHRYLFFNKQSQSLCVGMSHEFALLCSSEVGRLEMFISFPLMRNLPCTQTQKLISTKKPQRSPPPLC